VPVAAALLNSALQEPPAPPIRRLSRAGFTLIEILVGLAILTLVAGVSFALLSSVSKAWQRGTELSKDLHAGDFVIEQLVQALRAARYRDGNDGLILDSNGDGPGARDELSWVKEGPDLVGEDSFLAKTYHRLRFFIGRDATGTEGALYTAWGDEYLQPDDFDPEEIEPELLSDRVIGLDVRVATNHFERGDTLTWMNQWDEKLPNGENMTNHVPRFVEITLFLKPLGDGEPPVEMRRMVDIPMARQEGYK
jgi:prepilin-type N-terminal cleavage/methylation domain-containing protein